MCKIYKYSLGHFTLGIENHLLMNKYSEILSFRIQGSDDPVLWAIVDDIDNDNTELRTFILYFTGASIDEKDSYIGTDIDGNGLVWHCFERFN
jgi:hypothetical protein